MPLQSQLSTRLNLLCISQLKKIKSQEYLIKKRTAFTQFTSRKGQFCSLKGPVETNGTINTCVKGTPIGLPLPT